MSESKRTLKPVSVSAEGRKFVAAHAPTTGERTYMLSAEQVFGELPHELERPRAFATLREALDHLNGETG